MSRDSVSSRLISPESALSASSTPSGRQEVSVRPDIGDATAYETAPILRFRLAGSLEKVTGLSLGIRISRLRTTSRPLDTLIGLS
jgi:hypothetical protein